MRDADWVMPAIVLLLLQYFSAIFISQLTGFAGRPQTFSYMIMALVLSSIGGLAILLHRLWRMWREGEEGPIERLRADTDPAAVVTYFLGFQLVALQIAALTWLKEMLPWAIPYWADPPLAAFDRAVLGTDAWRIIPDRFIHLLDVLYTTWAPVKFFALMLALVLPASRLKAQAMMAYFLTVGLIGVSGQYLLSSGGPIFYDRLVNTREFGALALRTRELAPIAHTASEYLWHSYLGRDTSIGNGISAMPSIHVATTTWASMIISRFWRKAAVAIWTFWVIIFAGSIALGWHYLSDGIVGAGGAVLCWKLAPRLLLRSSRLNFRRLQKLGNHSENVSPLP
ncbi:phosphatase PAP2 family protein [Sphingomonas sp. G124]|uniref:Phosphatase PAP2 family protein n=1 Tax=Sphingomonas cremea TaxID=2904799 RepID=A0A9X1TY71_9SPHN|nr:phosphatase PAP2 family protein [Sphingomonas cremea]MCF2514823.1 phosphatase PAP2 family protein [Sphingomonas cremea]